MIYLDVEDLLHIATQILPTPPVVREWGLLSASAARPQTEVFGFEPYPTVADKAAALLVSLALNHCLLDGNKRLALAAALTFGWINTGARPTMSNNDAYELVIAVCEHRAEVSDVAAALREAGFVDTD